jgi:hypothetical protein
MSRNSRYKDSKHFAADPGLPAAFRGIRPRDIGPATGIVEYRLKEWDRMDRLSFNYYNDCDLWWRVLDANPEVLCAADLFIEPETQAGSGTQDARKTLLIPGSRE